MEKKYNVAINGLTYSIMSDRSEEDIRKIEAYVNNKITSIIDANPKVSIAVAAIFTALNAAEEMFAEKEASDRIREQVTSYSEQAYIAQSKMEEYKEKYENLLKEIKG